MRSIFEKLEEVSEEINHLEEGRERMIIFMDSCPAVCFIKDGESGKYIYVNEAFKKLINGKDVIGLTDADLFSLEDAKRWVGHDLEVLKCEQTMVTVECWKDETNTQRFFIVTKFVIKNGRKYLAGILVELPEKTLLGRQRKEPSKR